MNPDHSIFLRPSDRVRRRVLVLGAFLLAGALWGCGGGEAATGRRPVGGPGRGPAGGGRPAPEAVLVEARPVVLGDIASVYTSTGTLRAEREAEVKARLRGRVETVLVEEGDRVEEGQILARLEDEELRIARDRAQATAANARIKYERAESLRKKSLVSQESYHEARHNYEVAQADAEMADLELSYAALRAPIPGRVAERHVAAGQEVAVGDPLFRIVDEDPLLLELFVPERLVGQLAPGQSVDLTLDASGRRLEGRIARLSPVVDRATGTVKVTVELRSQRDVRTGSFARARVVTDLHEEARIVPREALISEGEDWYLFVVEEGKARKRRVKLGFEEASRVEILEGVDPGVTVVVTGASVLEDEMPVEVLEASTPDTEPPASADAAG